MRRIGLTWGIFFGELAELLRQEIFAGNAAAADPKLAAQGAVKLLHSGNGFALEGEQILRPFGEHEAQWRQTDLSRHAIEQFAADRFFELLDMRADSGLAQREQLGSLRKTLMFSDPVENF